MTCIELLFQVDDRIGLGGRISSGENRSVFGVGGRKMQLGGLLEKKGVRLASLIPNLVSPTVANRKKDILGLEVFAVRDW